jgi:hypothetical protein
MKLIDRTIRYADLLLREDGLELSYEELACECFRLLETLPNDSSIVLGIVDAFH